MATVKYTDKEYGWEIWEGAGMGHMIWEEARGLADPRRGDNRARRARAVRAHFAQDTRLVWCVHRDRNV